MPLRGWALAASGHGEEGIAQIQQGLAAYQATGAARDRPYYLALLAEASAQVGQTAEGLEALAEALATLAKSGVRWWEAELYRLRGELLLQRAGHSRGGGSLLSAGPRRGSPPAGQIPGAARRHEPGRLWQQQGKRDEAHALLAPIYGWFTEGFDTADLQEAKALLEELATL